MPSIKQCKCLTSAGAIVYHFKMYAIIETGGKQYRVEKGTKVTVELLEATVGSALKFTDLLNNAAVTAKVIEHGKGEKLNIFKYKPKKNVRKRMGHRQPYTLLEIQDIKAVKGA